MQHSRASVKTQLTNCLWVTKAISLKASRNQWWLADDLVRENHHRLILSCRTWWDAGKLESTTPRSCENVCICVRSVRWHSLQSRAQWMQLMGQDSVHVSSWQDSSKMSVSDLVSSASLSLPKYSKTAVAAVSRKPDTIINRRVQHENHCSSSGVILVPKSEDKLSAASTLDQERISFVHVTWKVWDRLRLDVQYLMLRVSGSKAKRRVL